MRTHFTFCPEPACGAAATVEREELWPSTDGGIMMAKVIGACGHWFVMPAWQLDLAGVIEASTDRTRLARPLPQRVNRSAKSVGNRGRSTS